MKIHGLSERALERIHYRIGASAGSFGKASRLCAVTILSMKNSINNINGFLNK
jgi:hypothetical protein